MLFTFCKVHVLFTVQLQGGRSERADAARSARAISEGPNEIRNRHRKRISSAIHAGHAVLRCSQRPGLLFLLAI